MTIPYEDKAGVMIIEATINGEKGSFLFDTGAPNVISEEFAEKLQLKTLAKSRVNDSGGNTTKGNANVRLDSVVIGGVLFENTGAVVQNLSSSDIFRCLDFDGIIGANLMKLAYWKLDFQKQEITFTSNLEDLELNAEYDSIPFTSKFTGTPMIDVKLNHVNVRNIVFDTGSNGHISVPTASLNVLSDSIPVERAYSLGATRYGVGGISQTDTTYFAIIDSISMGEIILEKKVVEFEPVADNIGMDFFKNYDIIMDWENDLIHMRKVQEYDYDDLTTFGFGVNLTNGQVLVGSIHHNSPSDGVLNPNDRILRIDEFDFEGKGSDLICEMIRSKSMRLEDRKVIEMVIDREGETKTIQLEKKVILSLN